MKHEQQRKLRSYRKWKLLSRVEPCGHFYNRHFTKKNNQYRVSYVSLSGHQYGGHNSITSKFCHQNHWLSLQSSLNFLTPKMYKFNKIISFDDSSNKYLLIWNIVSSKTLFVFSKRRRNTRILFNACHASSFCKD